MPLPQVPIELEWMLRSRESQGVVSCLVQLSFSLGCTSAPILPFYQDGLDASGVSEQGKPKPNIEGAWHETARAQGQSPLSILVHAYSFPQNHMYADMPTKLYAHHGVLQCEVGESV
jgi:hypothetical protein